MTTTQPSPQPDEPQSLVVEKPAGKPICQLCNGRLIEIRGKLQCERCHTIWETCCEGGRW